MDNSANAIPYLNKGMSGNVDQNVFKEYNPPPPFQEFLDPLLIPILGRTLSDYGSPSAFFSKQI